MSIVPSTGLLIRGATAGDVEPCARIYFDAFASIANHHAFPIEPGTPEFARHHTRRMLVTDGIVGLVAERDGAVVGSAFADARNSIVGIGPVTVDPAAQEAGVGRALMEALLEAHRGATGIRLVQTAYQSHSLALYAKLGFVVREPLSVLQGAPPARAVPAVSVRAARPQDVPACNALCRRVHGHDRDAELRAAIGAGTARVVERSDGLSGYATGVGYGRHAVGGGNADLMALIAATDAIAGLGVLVPSRNAELLAWCLGEGLHLVQQSTLMTVGFYSSEGAWLPSILY